MEEYERPELEIRIEKHGISRFFPSRFFPPLDILPLKFKVIVHNRRENTFKLHLHCERDISGSGGIFTGTFVWEGTLAPKEVLEHTFALRLEPGKYHFSVTTKTEDGKEWGEYKIQGLSEFRVIDGRSLVLGTAIGLLISLALTLLLNCV